MLAMKSLSLSWDEYLWNLVYRYLKKDSVLVSSVENLLSLLSLSRWHVRRKMSLDNCPSLSVIAAPSISVHSVSVARWWWSGGCRVASMKRGLGCPVLAPARSSWLQLVSTSTNQLQPVPASSSLFQPVPAGSSQFQQVPTSSNSPRPGPSWAPQPCWLACGSSFYHCWGEISIFLSLFLTIQLYFNWQ